MLILFDIDATLLTTSRSGVAAMGDAGRELYGETFNEHTIQYAGRLDPLIFRDLMLVHGVEPTRDRIAEFYALYRERLRERLRAGVARAMPGVHDLLGALAPGAARGEYALGLLTGNYPDTGEMKLVAAGIDPSQFSVRAWGCDSPHDPPAREHLPPVAMARHRERHGREIRGEAITIIGDTPHDVSCALAHGCRALGVATGSFGLDDLHRAGAHRAVPSLENTEEITRWLTSGDR